MREPQQVAKKTITKDKTSKCTIDNMPVYLTFGHTQVYANCDAFKYLSSVNSSFIEGLKRSETLYHATRKDDTTGGTSNVWRNRLPTEQFPRKYNMFIIKILERILKDKHFPKIVCNNSCDGNPNYCNLTCGEFILKDHIIDGVFYVFFTLSIPL